MFKIFFAQRARSSARFYQTLPFVKPLPLKPLEYKLTASRRIKKS